MFLAGDVRVNENPGLQSLHTLFVKEHNRLAKEIYQQYPGKDDEAVFQETRKYVIAEWQNIVYSEWLPMVIGELYMDEHGLFNSNNSQYDATGKPTITQEFSTAAFRFGHGLIRSIVNLYALPANTSQSSDRVDPIKRDTLKLSDQFFSTDIIQENKVDELYTGMTKQKAKEFGPELADAVRLRLFRGEGKVFGNDLGKFQISSLFVLLLSLIHISEPPRPY